MIIYPAIDLRSGRVVRLTEGKFDQEVSRFFRAVGGALRPDPSPDVFFRGIKPLLQFQKSTP